MAEEQSGLGGKALDALKWLGREMVMPAAEKLIPQGAAEVAQALNTGQGYVPYGPTERPVGEPEAPQGTAHGMEAEIQQTMDMQAELGPDPLEANRQSAREASSPSREQEIER